jgi:hypothetical protein
LERINSFVPAIPIPALAFISSLRYEDIGSIRAIEPL